MEAKNNLLISLKKICAETDQEIDESSQHSSLAPSKSREEFHVGNELPDNDQHSPSLIDILPKQTDTLVGTPLERYVRKPKDELIDIYLSTYDILILRTLLFGAIQDQTIAKEIYL